MRVVVGKFMILFLLLLFNTATFAADNTELYAFASPLYKQRFYDLTNEFRCLVCQNQTLADSNAPLAQDMRKQILMMINQGETDKDITNFLVQRYGEFVRYQPPFNHATLLLWMMPAILLVIGLTLLLRYQINRFNKE